MGIHYVLYPLILVISILLSLIVFLSGRKKSVNLHFSAFLFSVFFWTFCNFLADIAKDVNIALFWSRMAIVGPAFMPAFLFYFSLIFPKERKKITKLRKIFIFLPTLFFLILTPTRLNVSQVRIAEWGADITSGILYYFLFIYFLVYLGLTFYQLIRSYQISSRVEKIQIRLLLLGLAIGMAWGLFTNLILPLFGIARFTAFGPVSMIIFGAFTTYAITKHHFLGIRVILTEGLVAVIALILLVQAALARTFWDIIFRLGILILFSYFGYLLIRSVLLEIRRREQFQKMTEELRAANLQLKRFDQAKSDFVDIASHQLRTPITGFKGYMSMLLEGDFGPLTKEQERVIRMSYENTERMSSLIDTFLDVTKIEAGRLDLVKEPVQLEDLIKEAFKILRFTAESKKLYLKFERPKEKLPKLNVDPQRIRDVLFNLIDNALKYTTKGGVTVSCEKKENELITHIKDTGMGIVKEEQAILFGKFIRRDRAVINPNGSGLGLFIVKKIIEAHQGKVWVESQGKGKGSTFSFSLPVS